MEPISMTISLLALGLDAGTHIHDRLGDRADESVVEVDDVPTLWDRLRDGTLGAGDRVAVTGTVAPYGPTTFGHPREVKRRHFALRETLADGDGPDAEPGTLDGLVSLSSGQPVVRVPPERGVRYAGLYEAIGRNGLPVFVDADAYEAFDERTPGRVRDATLTGTLEPVPEAWQDLVTVLDPDHGGTGYALHVGPDGLSDAGETTFFEADVWAVVESGGEQRWLSRCPDFARRHELADDVRTLAESASSLGPDATLVAEYDLEDRPVADYADVGAKSGVVQELANRDARDRYAEELSRLLGA
jgi:hypothetical protein